MAFDFRVSDVLPANGVMGADRLRSRCAEEVNTLWNAPVRYARFSVSAIILMAVAGLAQTDAPQTAFTDITEQSGIRAAIDGQYQKFTNWWLSGLNLVDLDGDGKLDIFFAAHGAGAALAVLNDGHG